MFQRLYYVTLITLDRSAWFGAWVKHADLRPFNILTQPESNNALDVPNADGVFIYARAYIFENNRNRALRFSFVQYMVKFMSPFHSYLSPRNRRLRKGVSEWVPALLPTLRTARAYHHIDKA